MSEILTIGELSTLATIIGWAQRGARLRWLALSDNGEIVEGTARSIGDENGNYSRSGVDVRDQFLRITTASGFEWFAPMRTVMVMCAETTMCADS